MVALGLTTNRKRVFVFSLDNKGGLFDLLSVQNPTCKVKGSKPQRGVLFFFSHNIGCVFWLLSVCTRSQKEVCLICFGWNNKSTRAVLVACSLFSSLISDLGSAIVSIRELLCSCG